MDEQYTETVLQNHSNHQYRDRKSIIFFNGHTKSLDNDALNRDRIGIRIEVEDIIQMAKDFGDCSVRLQLIHANTQQYLLTFHSKQEELQASGMVP